MIRADKDIIISLPKITDPRGTLSVWDSLTHISFSIQRVFWIYDVPEGSIRGGHMHKSQNELIVAVSGSFTVTLDDGKDQHSYLMDNPSQVLICSPGVWRYLEAFSPDAVCLVLADGIYNEDDYIKDYEEFLNFTKR